MLNLRRNKVLTLILGSLVFLAIGGIEVQAQGYKVLQACTVDWPPYTIIDHNTKDITGIDADILREAAKRLKADLKIVEMPWQRCLKLAEEGKIDIVFTASYKDDRAQFLHYTKNPIHELSYIFAKRTESEDRWENTKEAKDVPQPVSVPLGFSIIDKLKKENGVTLDTRVKTDEQNLDKLTMGRVGSIVIESLVFKWLTKKKKLTRKVADLSPPYEKGKAYYITVSKKALQSGEYAQQLKQDLEKTLEEMAQEGTIDEITKKYT